MIITAQVRRYPGSIHLLKSDVTLYDKMNEFLNENWTNWRMERSFHFHIEKKNQQKFHYTDESSKMVLNHNESYRYAHIYTA